MAESSDNRRSDVPTSTRGVGRPVKPQDGSESSLAALGAQLRRLRMQRALTLQNLAELTGYSWQHLGAVERGQVVPSENLIVACDSSLLANGKLIAMLAVVIREQAHVRHQNAAARRGSPTLVPREGRGPGETPDCSPDLDWERLADASRRPSRITTAIVEDLELITDPHQAVDAFEEALRMLAPSCDRRKAMIAVGLAHAHLASGELEEAQRRAATALVVFAERGSAAGLHRVRGVRDAFREAGHHAAALALDEQARAVRVAARG